jgi:hypothetical protein
MKIEKCIIAKWNDFANGKCPVALPPHEIMKAPM